MDEILNTEEVPAEIPSSLHMMRHIFRSANYSHHRKCFVNTDTALSLSQHAVTACLEAGEIFCSK